MSIMKKNLLFVCIALLTAITTMAGVPADIGAIMGKNVPLYPQHNAEKPNLDSPRSATLDYKLVTLDGISYVYLKASDNAVPAADWGMQYRYWSETMIKTENNLLSKFNTYATQIVTKPMPDPLKYITFYVSIEGDSETDFITYAPKTFNSIDESDKIAPSITNVDINPSIFTAALNITGDDEDAFYYIEDAANNYKTVAIIKDVILTGLTANTTYNLTITPIDFNGNRGNSTTKSFTTKADIQEVIVPVTIATFNCAEAGNPIFEEVEDPDKGTVVHVKATEGYPWAMVQANKPLPEGLGNTGKEFSYAHVIVKCPKVGQVIRGGFNGEVAMMNPFILENEWQDVMFDLGRTKINDIIIYLDYYGSGQGGTFPKELWLKEVIFNNSATPLIEWAKDEEKPILNSVSLIDNSITYSSVQINVSATDNIGVASYLVKDDVNNFSKEFKAIDNVVTIEGLTPGTTYNFSVQAKDAAGNLSDAIILNNVITVARASECSGDLGHFGTPDNKKIHYEISYTDGEVTFKINPLDENRTLTFAQMQILDKSGFEGMPIGDDGKTASLVRKNVTLGDVYYVMFVYSLDDMPGNEQTAENDKIEKRVFYIVGDCELTIPEDKEKPILTAASVVDGSITYNSVKLNVTATDNVGVTSYLVTDEANNFSGEFKAYSGVISVTGLTPATDYNLSVQAKDLAGNLSDPIVVNVQILARLSECSGELGHFSPADAEKMIYYEISYRSGSVTYRIEPNSSNSNYADKKINWAQIRRNVDGVYSGFDGMTIAEDGKSATYTLNDVIPGTIIYNMFVFGFEGSDAHYQNAENEKLDDYIFYIAGDCAGALEKAGTEKDPILSGKWNAETFASYNLNYANLTTLDLTEVSEINELPVMESLNPNCLIYVNKNSNISDATKNIAVFNRGVGTASSVVLQDGRPFNNTKEFTAASISYTRDFSGMNGWASLYLPFAVNVEGYTIETLADYTSQEDKGYFSFESVTGTTPNTPYIMAVNGETNGVFTGSGTIPVATVANDISIDNGAYVFKGTFNEIGTGSANGLYLLRTDGSEFAVGSDDSYVPAFRAYITSASAFAADRINVLHDGEVPPPPSKINTQNAGSSLLVWSANGVLEIVADKAQSVKICSIDGCIVRNMELNEGHNVITNLPKGIYIVNNQKIIIK